MHNIVRLPEAEEAAALVCENCSNWEMLHAHFFVYEDGSFRCTRCGAGFVFKNGE